MPRVGKVQSDLIFAYFCSWGPDGPSPGTQRGLRPETTETVYIGLRPSPGLGPTVCVFLL